MKNLKFTTYFVLLSSIILLLGCTPTKDTSTPGEEETQQTNESMMKTNQKKHLGAGACTYSSIAGVATITAINAEDSESVRIKFDFEPTEDTKYRYTNFPDKGQDFFVTGHGCCPPLSWCEKNGIKEGVKIKCERQEILEGACAPVNFRFKQFEENGWN